MIAEPCVTACWGCSVFALVCQLSLASVSAVLSIKSSFPLALPMWLVLSSAPGEACPQCVVVCSLALQLPVIPAHQAFT